MGALCDVGRGAERRRSRRGAGALLHADQTIGDSIANAVVCVESRSGISTRSVMVRPRFVYRPAMSEVESTSRPDDA